jgi:hypothetical protein
MQPKANKRHHSDNRVKQGVEFTGNQNAPRECRTVAQRLQNDPVRLRLHPMSTANLQTLFCERFNCAPADYERRALGSLLYPHARILVPVIRTLRPSFAAEDLKFVRYLGEADDFQDAANQVADFREVNRTTRSFLRKRCRLRVSGRKAGQLVKELFQSPENG